MMIGNMANIIFAVIGAIIITGVLVRCLKMFLSKEKSVKAKVTDKQKYEQRVATKMQAPYTENKYIITFLLMPDGKKASFEVSELSYGQYMPGQEGILTYKSAKIIDFS